MSNVIEVNDVNELNDLIQTSDSLLLDVSALAWCAPCKALAPSFERKAETSETTFVMIDLDSNEWVQDLLNVRSVPTLIYYERGTEVKRTSDRAKVIALLNEVE